MTKKKQTVADRDFNTDAFDMVRRLEEATSDHEEDYTEGSDKGAKQAEAEQPAEIKQKENR